MVIRCADCDIDVERPSYLIRKGGNVPVCNMCDRIAFRRLSMSNIFKGVFRVGGVIGRKVEFTEDGNILFLTSRQLLCLDELEELYELCQAYKRKDEIEKFLDSRGASEIERLVNKLHRMKV